MFYTLTTENFMRHALMVKEGKVSPDSPPEVNVIVEADYFIEKFTKTRKGEFVSGVEFYFNNIMIKKVMIYKHDTQYKITDNHSNIVSTKDSFKKGLE